MQSTKMVNSLILASFLALGACSSNTVSERDAATAAINAGKLAEARIHLNNALKETPGDNALRMLQARICLQTGDIEQARGALEQLRTDPAYKTEATILLGQALILDGKPKMALEILEGNTMVNGEAAAVAADSLFELGKIEEAKAMLDRGLAAFPKSPDLLQVDAADALALGDLPRARKDLAAIMAVNPNRIQTQLLGGRLELLDGSHNAAQKYFNRALELNANSQMALLGLAVIALDRGDLKTADTLLDRAINAPGVGSLAAISYKAQLALQAGKPELAESLLKRLPLDMEVPHVVMLRGLTAAALDQNERAISFLEKFFTRGNENPAARLSLAMIWYKTGDQRKAWTILKPLADAANANTQILEFAAQLSASVNALGKESYAARYQASKGGDPNSQQMVAAERAMATGEWQKADSIYSGLLAQPRNATNVMLLNNAANVKLKIGDKAQAIALARRAAALAPNDPYVNDTLGWSIFMQSGPTGEAIALINKAITAMPGDNQIRQHVIAVKRALAAQPK